MPTYRTSRALENDIEQMTNSSRSLGTTDPLVGVRLGYSSEVVPGRHAETRRDVALHNYRKGLMESIGDFPISIIVKSLTYEGRRNLNKASAWIQHFYPDPDRLFPWKEERGRLDVPPDSVSADYYRYIENALHTNRETFMRGKEHYCEPLRSLLLTKR